MEMEEESDQSGSEDASDAEDLDVLGIITDVIAFLHEVAENYPNIKDDALAAAKDLEEVHNEIH